MEQEIRNWIHKFIFDNKGIHIDESVSLLDPRNGLAPRDLLVIFFELQKQFNIEFTEEDIISQRFDFMNNIVNAVMKDGSNE